MLWYSFIDGCVTTESGRVIGCWDTWGEAAEFYTKVQWRLIFP